MRPLNALRLWLATDQLLDDRFPIAALAQEPLDELAKRAAAALRRQLPRRYAEDLGGGVGGSGGDPSAHHRRDVGKIVAGVKDLVEFQAELLQQLLGFIELARGALPQFLDPELARAALERGRVTRRDQRDRHARLLRQLHRQAVADVELFDLAIVADVDDAAVGPDAVDVGDDETDVGCFPHCAAHRIAAERFARHPERSRGTWGSGWRAGRSFAAPPARPGPSTTLGMTAANAGSAARR